MLLFVLFLSACDAPIPLRYDLVRAERQTPNEPVVVIQLWATPKRRMLGATIKNGPPYHIDAHVDHEIVDAVFGGIPVIADLKIYKVINDKDHVVSGAQVNIRQGWADRGALSFMRDVIVFSDVIEDKQEYCIDLTLRFKDQVKQERTCLLVIHEMGWASVTPREVINQ